MEVELWTFRVEEGLGNACALIFPDLSAGVIDWGTERSDALDRLFSLILRRPQPWLRFVAASHPHNDHTLGLEKLLARAVQQDVVVDRLYYPTPVAGSPNNGLRAARHVARELRISMSSVAASASPYSDPAPIIARGINPLDPAEGWQVRALAPLDTAVSIEEVASEKGNRTPGNSSSLVLQFCFFDADGLIERGRAVLPGDATAATLNFAQKRSAQYADLSLDNDALVVPHHGSQHNWVPWFDERIQGVAIVSAPSGRAKHPSKHVLKKLTRICGAGSDSSLFCTSYAGTCHSTFAEGIAGAPGKREPCFGDIGVRLSSRRPPSLIRHDAGGPGRRGFGHCGRR